MESEYNSPYDHHPAHVVNSRRLGGNSGGGSGGADNDGDLNHYEAPPTMLARNPSGSLYIPSGEFK